MKIKSLSSNRNGSKPIEKDNNNDEIQNETHNNLTIIRTLLEILIELNEDLILNSNKFASINLNTAAIEACEYIDDNVSASREEVQNINYIRYTLKHVIGHIDEVVTRYNMSPDIGKIHEKNVLDFIESCVIVKNRLKDFLQITAPDVLEDRPLDALSEHVDQILTMMENYIKIGILVENATTTDFRNSCQKFKKSFFNKSKPPSKLGSKESQKVQLKEIKSQNNDEDENLSSAYDYQRPGSKTPSRLYSISKSGQRPDNSYIDRSSIKNPYAKLPSKTDASYIDRTSTKNLGSDVKGPSNTGSIISKTGPDVTNTSSRLPKDSQTIPSSVTSGMNKTGSVLSKGSQGIAKTGSGQTKTGSGATKLGSLVTKIDSAFTKAGSYISKYPDELKPILHVSDMDAANPKLGYFERSTRHIKKVAQSKAKGGKIREVVETIEVIKEKFDSHKTDMLDDNSLEIDAENMVKEILRDRPVKRSGKI